MQEFYSREIAAGRMMGVVVRCGETNEARREVPVSLELGIAISHMVLDYVLEQQHLCEDKLASIQSRAALSTQEGGPAK